jgi:hypothetical protein
MWSREAFNPSWNGHAWEIYCPYCGLIVEAPSKPSSLAWRYAIGTEIFANIRQLTNAGIIY